MHEDMYSPPRSTQVNWLEAWAPWQQARLFAITFRNLMLRPRRFGADWASGQLTSSNPLGFYLAAFAFKSLLLELTGQSVRPGQVQMAWEIGTVLFLALVAHSQLRGRWKSPVGFAATAGGCFFALGALEVLAGAAQGLQALLVEERADWWPFALFMNGALRVYVLGSCLASIHRLSAWKGVALGMMVASCATPQFGFWKHLPAATRTSPKPP